MSSFNYRKFREQFHTLIKGGMSKARAFDLLSYYAGLKKSQVRELARRLQI